MSERIDMRGGANVMRCFADFISARPGLPEAAAVQVVWSFIARAWEIRVQLEGDAAGNVERWAVALDDPVITSETKERGCAGRYVRHQVDGTAHGHPVNVWTHLPFGGER
ncbi:hypothetical protein LO772_17120 [Yinghuangia sp. ASG 101]|uniref:hypothetical protein n=1 Tax=Yinghuangia sp. ASG 101 TaxID=2896848 RepID=UPI001E39EF79|nr:hypothetical protein [Yinghuangia sp. ASG 101]UGQ15133.1 hypothetical protein LO772_17120 [Yinghuangia sp. ASG 101]